LKKAEGRAVARTSPEQNKALVLEAFDTLFNKRDYDGAERYWSDRYIQHSAHIEPGRDGLFNLVRSLPDTLRYENQLILAEGDYVIAHGRFSGSGREAAWIAADIVRFEDGKLAEHWDVLQDEPTKTQSKSGLPMFGDRFPD
jgi:predicted SnoaL-like aldol condensation-catalyzing enzyme